MKQGAHVTGVANCTCKNSNCENLTCTEQNRCEIAFLPGTPGAALLFDARVPRRQLGVARQFLDPPRESLKLPIVICHSASSHDQHRCVASMVVRLGCPFRNLSVHFAFCQKRRYVAGCATPASSAGHAPTGTETAAKLTLRLDHSMGADQIAAVNARNRRSRRWSHVCVSRIKRHQNKES